MKRGTANHPKAKQLAQKLNSDRPKALGTLVMLWSWASEFTPAGDIGRYPDETIAEEVCWLGSPSELLRALLAAGWIQADSACRYRIHDWPDHCEDTDPRPLGPFASTICGRIDSKIDQVERR